MADSLVTIATRNQVLLERLKEGEHKKFAPYLKRVEKAIRLALFDAGDTITTKKRLNALLIDVTTTQRAIFDDYNKQLSLDLFAIGEQQAAFEAKYYEKVVVGFESTVPAAAQVLTAIRVNPLQVEGYTGNLLLEPFIKDWSTKEIGRVNNAITQGFYQGQTNSQIAQNIRGTKANRYNDGELAKVNRSNKSIVRTSVQHASQQARSATMKDNDDLVTGYEWVSTLDSNTTNQCKSLDGRKFKIGEGPLPPIHVNCRSTTVPTLSSKFDFLEKGATRASVDGPVSAKETYYSWLKKQTVKFQNDAIGPTRARLLNSGGLNAEQFAKLSLNKNFEPLTLAEMYKKDSSIFDNAGVKV